MLTADYVIVGSGLTGSTIARLLHDAGRNVLVLERRLQVGGNVVDTTHAPSGIRYSLHGPHYFRSNSERIWAFATRFSSFFKFEARVKTVIDGKLENWPVSAEFVERLAGKDWRNRLFTGTPRNFEEACLAKMPEQVYLACVRGYSLKQWGCDPRLLSASLCKRFDVREDDDDRLTQHRWQGLPLHGYSAWMENMLAGIPVRTNFDYLERRDEVHARKLLVFTGPIDAYFGHDLGRLKYRSQKRDLYHFPDDGGFPEIGQINFPCEQTPAIRRINWKGLQPPGAVTSGTVVTVEEPFTAEDCEQYEYPMPDEANARLYQRYRERVQALPGIVMAGRLGRYAYL